MSEASGWQPIEMDLNDTRQICERCGAVAFDPCPSDENAEKCELPDFCFMPDREDIAAILYMKRFPHRTWCTASLAETQIAYKQADEMLALFANWTPRGPINLHDALKRSLHVHR